MLDRNVFGFQINPILRRGEIKNINQYRIVHNYIEMVFENDPELFHKDPSIERLNSMMGKYHADHP